jgi:NADH-quinone oxidoreductase subunit A
MSCTDLPSTAEELLRCAARRDPVLVAPKLVRAVDAGHRLDLPSHRSIIRDRFHNLVTGENKGCLAVVLEQYSHLGILLIFAIIFPSIPLISSWALGRIKIRPNLPNAVKEDTYECGVETEGPTWVQFNFRYYLIALIFVIFDVEVIFLFPLAVALDSVLTFGLVAGLIFIGTLFLGLAYEWRKHALEWQ